MQGAQARYARGSDLDYHDRMLGYHYHEVERFTYRYAPSSPTVARGVCRKIVDRVKHLMHERMDYKGYGYVPVKAEWLEKCVVPSPRGLLQGGAHEPDVRHRGRRGLRLAHVAHHLSTL